LEAYQDNNIEEKSMTCEFYLHNLSLSHPYNWNQNPYVGDVQIMDFASWLRYEEIRLNEMKRYKEEELHNSLWIKVEVPRPKDVLSIHDTLSLDKDAAPFWEEKQVETMAYIEDTLRLME
jgi:hypothetical protein